MALGALSVIDSSSLGGGGGGSLKTMNPMGSMIATFKDIRDSLDDLVSITREGFASINAGPSVAESIAGADTDAGGSDDGGEKGGGMIDSLKTAFMDDGGFGKLKKALFIGVVASLLLFSEQLKAVVAPILNCLLYTSPSPRDS